MSIKGTGFMGGAKVVWKRGLIRVVGISGLCQGREIRLQEIGGADRVSSFVNGNEMPTRGGARLSALKVLKFKNITVPSFRLM